MKDRIDYIMNDARCELALEDFYNNVPESSWIYDNLLLYHLISIHQRPGQTIADDDHLGEHFDFIRDFHEVFKKIWDNTEPLF
jgi:hypothetical protein